MIRQPLSRQEILKRLASNPHYRLNHKQQAEIQTQELDVELTAPIVKRKRKSKPKVRQYVDSSVGTTDIL